MTQISPQPGPQEAFLSSPADIVIYGGAAGGGKTFGLLLEPLRHINVKGFGAVIFRRTSPQIRNEGGLWDTSEEIYPHVQGTPKESVLMWDFDQFGTSIKFAHLEHEKHKLDYQGAQIPLIEFDELTHFTESQFFYLLSRNRSTCGIRPYIRATTNPDADSWVAKFISWWISEDGSPIAERSGVIKWFIRVNNVIVWGDSREEIIQYYPESIPKSFTFIEANLADNKILEEKDPGYRANLMALPMVERERLLGGNWKVRPAAGMFKRQDFKIGSGKGGKQIRYWDLAATEKTGTKDPDWTVGCLMSESNGEYCIINIVRIRENPGVVEQVIRQTAQIDSINTKIFIEQEGGAAGKSLISYYARVVLQGFIFEGIPSSGSKIIRAQPLASAVSNGNVSLASEEWTPVVLDEFSQFPQGVHDDIVDACSGAFNELSKNPSSNYSGFSVPEKSTSSGLPGLGGSSLPTSGGAGGVIPGL